MTMKFHLDEHIDHAIARGLMDRGIDVTTVSEVGLLGASDEAQLAYCLSVNRVIVTFDIDFVVLAAQNIEHAGIIFCAGKQRSIGYIIRVLHLLDECYSQNEMIGHVEYI